MNDTFFTSKITKRIDRYNYNGIDKCMLHTEINTNVNPGDMVYITNGILDSEKIIERRKTDRHSKYINGYKVLHSEGCKVVIDYDYINHSYLTDEISKYLKVYVIETVEEMRYNNSIYVDTYESLRVNKFRRGWTNSFIYIGDSELILWIITQTDIKFTKIINGVLTQSTTSNYQEFGHSFYSNQTNNLYTNVNDIIDNGEFSLEDGFFSSSYINLSNSLGYLNNGKLLFNKEVYYNNYSFKANNPYKYLDNKWILDIEYKQPILSKLNFKRGHFRGRHNDGLFGEAEKQTKWNPLNEWNSGYMLNTLWEDGLLNSKSNTSEQSYYTSENDEVLTESNDFTNNKGYGYNFIEDSIFTGGEIINGNFINCSFNGGLTHPAVATYYSPITQISNVTFRGGKIMNSNVDDIILERGEVNNSLVNNSTLRDVDMINSEINQCVANGLYNSSDSIVISKAKMFTYDKGNGSVDNTELSAILRLYISERDYNKLSYQNSFTISKLNKEYVLSSVDKRQYIKLPIESRYLIDEFYNNHIIYDDYKIICTLKSNIDNLYNRNIHKDDLGNYVEYIETDGGGYSIDIELGYEWSFYTIDGSNVYNYINLYFEEYPYINDNLRSIPNSTILSNLFDNILIERGSFNSGILMNTTVEHGDFINLNNYIKYEEIYPGISYTPELQCYITGNYIGMSLHNFNKNLNDNITHGDIIWVNELVYRYNDNGVDVDIDLSGPYRILNITANDTITIYPVEQSIADNITDINNNSYSGIIRYKSDTMPAFMGIHRRLHLNNKIKSGLLLGENIKDSVYQNDDFDNNDKYITYSNVGKLRVMNTGVNSSVVKSGLFFNSYISDVKWESGIVYLSIWDNIQPFEDGSIVESIWYDGEFNGGSFYNNGYQYTPPVDPGFGMPLPKVQHKELSKGYNFRHIWEKGSFNGGLFEKSYFKGGSFNGGKFIDSYAYRGRFNGGVIGDKSINYLKTTLGSVGYSDYVMNPKGDDALIISGATVENALVGGSSTVYWESGTFNGGVLTSMEINPNDLRNLTIKLEDVDSYRYNTLWENGTFNGGKVTGGVIWENGTFNGGNFEAKPTHHYYNNDEHITDNVESTYGGMVYIFNWLDGVFNGGTFGTNEFPTENYIKPSWRNGTFNGGTFLGRVWKDGVVTGGEFRGDKSPQLIGGRIGGGVGSVILDQGSLLSVNSFDYIKTLTTFHTRLRDSSMGIYWLGGTVTDSIYDITNIDEVYIKPKLSTDLTRTDNSVYMTNIGWMSGIVNHKSAIINNTMWLDGKFQNGRMTNSTFNPKQVVHPSSSGQTSTDPQYNDMDTCIWENGVIENSIFNISTFKNGTSINSILNGVIWENGTFNGGVANNILWKNGIWKNGIWNGSSFDKTDDLNDTIGDAYVFTNNIRNHELNTFVDTDSDTYIHVNNILKENSNGIYHQNVIKFSKYIQPDPNTQIYVPDLLSMRVFPRLDGATDLDRDWTVTDIRDSSYGAGLIFAIPIPEPYNRLAFKVMGIRPGEDSKMLNIGDNNRYELLENDTFEYILTFSVKYASFTMNLGGSPNLGNQVFNDNLGGEMRLYIDVAQLVNSNVRVTGLRYDNGRPYVIITSTQTDYRIPIPKISVDGALKTINFSVKYIKPNNPPLLTNITRVVTLAQSSTQEDIPYLTRLVVEYSNNSNKLFKQLPQVPNLPEYLGDDYTYNYGNGQFLGGTWENGTWNTGYRNDENSIFVFNKFEYQSKVDDYTHLLYFNLNEFIGDLTGQINLKVGDKVSIGNIIGIDINGRRVILNDIYHITQYQNFSNGATPDGFVIKVTCKDVIRSISIDSENHPIKISTNIWLNGKVQTGRFINSVINNITLNGDNFSTILDFVNIINGTINGGTINTTLNSASGYIQRWGAYRDRVPISGISIGGGVTYTGGALVDTGAINFNNTLNASGFSNIVPQLNSNYVRTLIQNAYIDDNYYINKSSEEDAHNVDHFPDVKFKTILNLYYPNTSTILDGVAEGGFSNFYTSSETNKKFTNRGRITYDILSSESSIYNPVLRTKVEHTLGSKYTIFENVIPFDGNFDTSTYDISPKPSDPESMPEYEYITNFKLDGWKVVPNKWKGLPPVFRAGSNVDYIDFDGNDWDNYIPDENDSKYHINKWVSTEDRMVLKSNNVILTNTNTKEHISKRSYTMLDIKLAEEFHVPQYEDNGQPDNWINGIYQDSPFYKKYGIKLTVGFPETDKNLYYNEPTAIILGQTRRIKEFYYNADQMNIATDFSGYHIPGRDIGFDNISYCEVDMIPFYKYFSNNNVNKYFKPHIYDTFNVPGSLSRRLG